jgi:ABC-2 type transport system permease protein
MINEMRVANAQATKESDKILKGFFRDHPELAPQDTTAKNMYDYYLRAFASQEVVRKEVRPVIEDFEHKLEAQQSWVESFRFSSPSLLLQDAFNDLAGTSPRQYESYRKQVMAFAEAWRNYFVPRMFRNETMKQAEFTSLPSFTFDYGAVSSTFSSDLLGMICFALVALTGSVAAYRRYAGSVLFG